MDQFVDNLIEDEVERETLLSKPTCFIIVGKPGVGKSTLAQKIAESWRCILIDDTDLLNTHITNETKEGLEILNILSEGESIPEDKMLQLILARLDSPDVAHYGYVLSCLPCISEECLKINEQIELIKNLKLTPDFIINIKCADKDLAQRLSNLKQCSETGQLYTKNQWGHEDIKKKEDNDEEVEDEGEQTPQAIPAEEELEKDVIDQLVWPTENLARNAFIRINMYKDTVLRPLEDYMEAHNPMYLLELDGNNTPEELHSSVMSRLGSMAIKRVSIPILLYQADDDELPEDVDTEDLLRIMSSAKVVAPGFRWRRSRWGRTCPVALKEGQVIPGKSKLSVGFQDKLYILSSQEAYQKFVTNPRRYLLPPMPRLPCRVSIIGPPRAGKSTLCKLLAQHCDALVLDMEELVAKGKQEKLDTIKEETTQDTIQKTKEKMEQDLVTKDPSEKQLSMSHFGLYAEALENHMREIEEGDTDTEVRTGWVLDNFPKTLSQMESLQQGEILPDIIFCLKDSGGNHDAPEMNDHKLQQQQFLSEWEQMQPALTVAYSVLEIDGKSPEDLLQEMVLQMEKPFMYVPWELSAVDLDEEEEDNEALAELQRAEEGGGDDDAIEEEDEESKGGTTSKRLLGDAHHFCPVALKNNNVLWPCTDEIAAKYREKIFYFSSTEARDAFLEDPTQFVARTEPLKPPALRVFLLGTRASGKTSHGEWLAQQLGLFYIQFREQLQMLIMAKTQARVPYADEEESSEESPEYLDTLIKEARGNDVEAEEDTSANMNDTEQEMELTDEEMAIKAYLAEGDPLTPEILDMVIAPYWKEEPYMSTGFILEGFPINPDEVQYMLQQQLFPDTVIIMSVDVTEVQKRLLPTYLEKWRERRNHRKAQQKLLHDLRKKNREEKIVKRRAELMEENGPDYREDEEDGEDADNIEAEIEAMLEEEFPLEEDDVHAENEETEDAAIERLEMEIQERFVTDENNIVTVTELLGEQNIPSVSISASPKPRIVRNRLLQKFQPLLTNRESLLQKCQPISNRLALKLLVFSYKLHSAFGCWDPIKLYNERELIQPLQWPLNATHTLIFNQYIYFFASKENLNTFMLNPLKYLRQPKPSPSLPVKIAVLGPPKSGKTTVAQMFAQKYGLARLSIGSVMRLVLDTQEHTDLAVQMKKHLCQGLVVPDELAIQCLEVALMTAVCSTQGYVLDGFPMTLKQAELMGSRSIIPMIVTELELDTVEVLKRGHLDKMKPNKPHLVHDNTEIRNSHYRQEVEQVRKHFQQQYQNWILLDGLKSKWWIWNSIIKEVSISMTFIHNYLERTCRGQAACINRLCITPKELQFRLGEFGQYCPVCLALRRHLVDSSEVAALTHAPEYRGKYYKMCGQEHSEMFMSTPDQFVTPGCPQTLPQPHLLPRKLTPIQVKNKFPQQVEMQGFCPVTYLDGKQRYEALVRGKMEYAVEYKERIYICKTEKERDMFLRTPETYWDQTLPRKVPPLCVPVPLTSLPTLGYLEQGMSVAVIKAMTAVGCLKPKYPFLSVKRSAVFYVAFYLKAFNHDSTEQSRRMYKKKLALFEENCALIPYLSSTVKGNYRPPGERPIDFEFKLNRFLALGDMQGSSCLL
ncbi:adenylate kinase 9 isoform X1 [Scophthalmus maximus]|uniref:adenylate kinase 9 isoform X1 n=2 Tax=Scophthalmus maximus TaxID=52904 RepID=UPI001FA8FE81|nr:adenylate kinase 9 isoform X1 [Scophthalmus maximus]